MTALGRALARIAEALHRHNVDFAVVGGLAVSVRAEPRMTRDADVAVLVGSDDDAEALLYRLMSDGFVVDTAIEQVATGRLATARLRHPESGSLVTDLLFASSGIEPEVVASANSVEVLPGLRLPVASVGFLIALKLLARDDRQRPNDADDLASLRAVATGADWLESSHAVQLIEQRGYHRDRDLQAALDKLRRNGAYGPDE